MIRWDGWMDVSWLSYWFRRSVMLLLLQPGFLVTIVYEPSYAEGDRLRAESFQYEKLGHKLSRFTSDTLV